jgi:hypothetical protein
MFIREKEKNAVAKMCCLACGGIVFWPSRPGHKVCAHCHSNPLQALQVLAYQRNGTATDSERMAEPVIDMPDKAPPEHGFWSLEDTLKPGTHWQIAPRGSEGHQHGTTLPSPAALIP